MKKPFNFLVRSFQKGWYHLRGHKKSLAPLGDPTPVSRQLPNATTIKSDDRGTARYFHGRARELAEFANELYDAVVLDRGTILLFQGAPGVGKSALLVECAAAARREGWKVVSLIGLDGLHNPAALARDLNQAYTEQTVAKRGGAAQLSGEVGILRIGQANVALAKNTGKEKIYSGADIRQLLETAGEKKPLLLVADEIQDLAIEAASSPEVHSRLRNVLDSIHNGRVKGPVVLLGGGLESSVTVLAKLGISRFREKRVLQLGRLSPETERTVIQDYLVYDGKAKGNVTPWIDAIVQETHGWPQHIVAFAQHAARVLQKTEGRMTKEAFQEVLTAGKKAKEEYYMHRWEGIPMTANATVIEAVQLLQKKSFISTEDILRIFSQGRTETETNQLVELVIHKGILSKVSRDKYHVPIPSLQTWILEPHEQPIENQEELSPIQHKEQKIQG